MDATYQKDLIDNTEQPKRVTVEEVKEHELQWLARCAVGDVKTTDILADLPFLLKEGGFLTTQAKYAGGFRYVLECESTEDLVKLLQEGKEALSNWFQWIKPCIAS